MNEHDPAPDQLELLRRLRQLPRERAPQRDLWPAIAARVVPAGATPLRRRRPSLVWSGLALAASLAGVALLAARRDVAVPSVPMAAAPAFAAPPSQALRHEADALTLEYRMALQTFEAAPMPPALRAAALELDASASQLRLALREQPHAPYLLDRLRHTYDQRLKLAQRGALG